MAKQMRLPPQIRLEYLAEGNANLIYQMRCDTGAVGDAQDPMREADLHSRPNTGGEAGEGNGNENTTPPPTDITPSDTVRQALPDDGVDWERICHDSLLRLRKNVPWIKPIALLQKQQQELIAPLFPAENLVEQTLVEVPHSVMKTLNKSLRDLEMLGDRPKQRHGTYLAEDEPHGLLVTNMAPSVEKGELLVELKPKWLAQSPNAPTEAKRCRTCALRCMRAREGKGKPEGAWCPLKLVSGSEKDVRSVLDTLVTPPKVERWSTSLGSQVHAEEIKGRLTASLTSSELLVHLRDLQKKLDPHGILDIPSTETVPQDLLIATTVRDCTLYLRTSIQHGNVDAKLGDLDLKDPVPSKIQHWHDMEADLLKGGWYTDGLETFCLLSE